MKRVLLDLCVDAEFRAESARLLEDSEGWRVAAVPFLERLVNARILDRIAARVAYLITTGEFDPRDLKEVLPQRLLRARPVNEADADQPFERPPALEAGQLVGRSVIENLLCSGPHGALYRATHIGLCCPVVVKVASLGRPAEQLRTESVALSEIAHRNVVRLWDAGTHGQFPYITTEYIERGSLKEELARRGSLEPDRVLRLASDAARGLRAALELGFVHCDVKPGNLLLGSDDTCKVADFGTACRAPGTASGDAITGSWPYVAPERFGEVWDHRVDIYALGLTIYCLLTGSPPVAAHTPRECLRLHRELSLEPLHWTVPRVSRAASALFLRMAARDPEKRPATYDELLAELSRVRNEPADASDPHSEGCAP